MNTTLSQTQSDSKQSYQAQMVRLKTKFPIGLKYSNWEQTSHRTALQYYQTVHTNQILHHVLACGRVQTLLEKTMFSEDPDPLGCHVVMVDILRTMVDILLIKVDILRIMVDILHIMVDILRIMVGILRIMVDILLIMVEYCL